MVNISFGFFFPFLLTFKYQLFETKIKNIFFIFSWILVFFTITIYFFLQFGSVLELIDILKVTLIDFIVFFVLTVAAITMFLYFIVLIRNKLVLDYTLSTTKFNTYVSKHIFRFNGNFFS